jgi:Predicted GTPase, probable translation factor
LIFADMETVSNRLDKVRGMIKTGDKKYAEEAEVLEKLLKHLESGLPARSFNMNEDEHEYVDRLMLLTIKPMIYAANISENDLNKPYEELPLVKAVMEQAKKENTEVLVISAKVEEELAALPEDEQKVFFEELGIEESGLNRLVKKCYSLLGLISYLTAGEKETRAWTITEGTKAPQAAGKIHSDFEKGFIRAEIVPYETLLECGNYVNAKEKGKVRSEGKDYVIKDGDVVLFRFNV